MSISSSVTQTSSAKFLKMGEVMQQSRLRSPGASNPASRPSLAMLAVGHSTSCYKLDRVCKLGLTASCIGRSSSTRADALQKTQRTTTPGRTGRP